MKQIAFIISFLLFFSPVEYINAQPKATAEKTKLLESFGKLSSYSIYLTYLSISYLEKDITRSSSDEDLKTIIESIQNITLMIKDDIAELKKTVTLIKEDKVFIESVLEITELLNKDAELLKIYAISKKEEDRKTFFTHHNELYNKINVLFYGEDEQKKENTNANQ